MGMDAYKPVVRPEQQAMTAQPPARDVMDDIRMHRTTYTIA
jgi:hypothetical protein